MARPKSKASTSKSKTPKEQPVKKSTAKSKPAKKTPAKKNATKKVAKSIVPKKTVKSTKSTKLNKSAKVVSEPDQSTSKNVEVEKQTTPQPTSVLEFGPPRKVEVVFSFDTTASMYSCLVQVRRKVKETVERLFNEIGPENLRIGITAHGDYCCAKEVYLTKHLPMTTNVDTIVDFVENVAPTWGYTYPEAYEKVLEEAQNFAWMEDWAHVLVIIGDDVAHEKDDNPGNIDWREEVEKLKKLDVTIHSVQCLNRSHATNFYAELARRGNGCHLLLDQFSSIVDLVMAVCYRESNQQEKLQKYELEIQAQPGRYNRSVRFLFDKMLGRTANAAPPPGNMNVCLPGRFQVLEVDEDTPIKDFVVKQGADFKKGRGFYQFTKPETVQHYKEIVLMCKSTGDMFEGDYARTLLGLPTNAAAKIRPSDHEYFFFIQSTSHNRRLVAGTRFLYEISNSC
ncbi:VWA domain-containing protein [Aphelenchoides bicaudatus]|nr:VWA domain-containing protein [Aphelenchoides bicaudatus]